MTSAQNLRQQLNGNKTLPRIWAVTLLLLLGISLSSCELFKPISQGGDNSTTTGPTKPKDELDPIQGRRVYDPITGTYVLVQNSPTDPMDTIVWREIPNSVEPPIYSTSAPVIAGPGGSNPVTQIGLGEGNSELLTSYNVAVVLPFLSDRYNSIDRSFSSNSTWALQFYNGMELGFEELEENGVALNVTVFDSKANERVVGELARSNRDLNNAHLILGPYLRSNATILADKARVAGSVLVSPHSASSNVSFSNPNYVQVKPTLESHCQAIMQHVMKSYNRDQIVLVGINTPAEIARFDLFQKEYERRNGLQDIEPLKQLLVDSTQTDMQSVDLKPWFSFDRETVFIVPSWSEETFVYNFLRKLDIDRTDYQRVVVYGMPQWMNYERIDFDYYEKLNVHVSSSVFIDNLDSDIRQFKRRYYERFGEIPKEEAFIAYDVTRYFGNMLHQHGTKFQIQLERNPQDMLHTNFSFQRVVTPTTTGAEFLPVQRWENKYVNILKFENYRFNKVN